MNTYASSESTKLNLINAAGELAAVQGFLTISTRAIAERSGENIGSIHYHFGSKDGLLEKVVRTAITDIKESTKQLAGQIESNENVTPQELSSLIQQIVHQQITIIFDPLKPRWYSQVIYQLIQLEGNLYDIFERDVLIPDMNIMGKLMKAVNPTMSPEQVLLHSLLLKMPIFAHANYMPAILKLLKSDHYSDNYLVMLENMLVRQTQLLLDLPLAEKI